MLISTLYAFADLYISSGRGLTSLFSRVGHVCHSHQGVIFSKLWSWGNITTTVSLNCFLLPIFHKIPIFPVLCPNSNFWHLLLFIVFFFQTKMFSLEFFFFGRPVWEGTNFCSWFWSEWRICGGVSPNNLRSFFLPHKIPFVSFSTGRNSVLIFCLKFLLPILWKICLLFPTFWEKSS